MNKPLSQSENKTKGKAKKVSSRACRAIVIVVVVVVCIVIESCSFYTYILDYVGFMLDSRWVFIFTSPAHPSFADIDADADPDLIWM
ncbi:hypothetical protein N7509_003263 [Penicillium cosmopolitanum]|uniref:Transmembrane protein n=1 Tax=Penicillium cosmopolitanum TaxID=1131564 RepID=A0A9X0BBB6_9EURO|nr:uncharacterized protein N7509_003263 [Penicillium cosmopolitanum]KAJ5403392.1 hypothetical protein N7509_003263 [Penicillium cosmopolitanum]